MLQTLQGFERIWLNSDIDQSRQWLKRHLTPAQRSITKLRFWNRRHDQSQVRMPRRDGPSPWDCHCSFWAWPCCCPQQLKPSQKRFLSRPEKNCVHSSYWPIAVRAPTTRRAVARLAALLIRSWTTPDCQLPAKTPSGNWFRPHRWSPPTASSAATVSIDRHAVWRWSVQHPRNRSNRLHQPRPKCSKTFCSCSQREKAEVGVIDLYHASEALATEK